jgi:alpha-ketoglutarate-dependent taurine dioxygenase
MMGETEANDTGRFDLRSGRRKAVNVASGELATFERLLPEATLPLVVRPAMAGVSLSGWAARNRELIEAKLSQAGALLFRDFEVRTVGQFEQFIRSLSEDLLEYSFRSTPRSHVSGRIYTSTEYPADQSIPLHNEMSYTANWPMKLWFFCAHKAERGGETPIADSRKIFQRLAPAEREKFARVGVMYVRNYGAKLDLSWQNVFQTSDRAEVEAFCRRASIEFEWKGEDGLRTRQVCQATAMHPRTREQVWFNQAHLFHVSSLEPSVRETLLSLAGEEELPRNAYYGDGTPIEAALLDRIREIYREEAVVFHWQEGDVLMLDNMLAAHGRKPFSGLRKVFVGMAEAFGSEGTAAS